MLLEAQGGQAANPQVSEMHTASKLASADNRRLLEERLQGAKKGPAAEAGNTVFQELNPFS